MSNEKHTCECEVRSDTRILLWHTCGKPAKGQLKDGTWACGIHLRAERRREEADKAYQDKWDRRRVHEDRLEKLSAELGLTLLPAYDYPANMNYVRVQVSLESLLKALGHQEDDA